MAAYYITDQLCACGCKTRMPSTIVDRGWKYLKGHKPAHLRPDVKAVSDRPVQLAAKVYSYGDAKTLAEAEILCLEEQLEELDREIETRRMAAQDVRARLVFLHDLVNAAQHLEAKHG